MTNKFKANSQEDKANAIENSTTRQKKDLKFTTFRQITSGH